MRLDSLRVAKFLKFLAASEIAGAVLLLLSLVAPNIPSWYRIVSLFVAIYAIAAGFWLWKNSPVGYWLSLPVQAVQLFQIVTNAFLIKTSIGFQAGLFVWTNGGFNISPGFGATLGIWGAGHGEHPGFGVNVLAFASMYLLFLAIKSSATATATDHAQQRPISVV
jgi:hypothetical protein